MICLWSAAYYTLDFFQLVPLVVSARDGSIEHSAVRLVMIWPVTSTLMISKVAVLCMMTRGQEPHRDAAGAPGSRRAPGDRKA